MESTQHSCDCGNQIEIRGDIIAIILTRRDGPDVEALIDYADCDLVCSGVGKWSARLSRNTMYAQRQEPRRSSESRLATQMHRLITGAGDRESVDHLNGNGLDNRRKNLRIVDDSTNMLNRAGAQANHQYGIRGVYRRSNGRWQVRAQRNGTLFYLGTFGTRDDAIAARKTWDVANGAISRNEVAA